MSSDEQNGLKAMVVRSRTKGGQYPTALRRKLIAEAERMWRSGASIKVVSEKLGISTHTLSYWRAVEGIARKPKVVPVKVVADARRTIDVNGPCGVRVAMTIDELAALLKRLA